MTDLVAKGNRAMNLGGPFTHKAMNFRGCGTLGTTLTVLTMKGGD